MCWLKYVAPKRSTLPNLVSQWPPKINTGEVSRVALKVENLAAFNRSPPWLNIRVNLLSEEAPSSRMPKKRGSLKVRSENLARMSSPKVTR